MYIAEITNKTKVGMIENEKKAITSFVFSLAPRILRRRSMKSLPMFLKTSQTRAIRMMMLTFSKPKKKIEVTKGRVLDTLVSWNSATVREIKSAARKTINRPSRLRFSRSLLSKGGILSILGTDYKDHVNE